MGEIKTKPFKLQDMSASEVDKAAKDGAVVFTPNHSIADIIRYAIECGIGTGEGTEGGIREVEMLLDMEKRGA